MTDDDLRFAEMLAGVAGEAIRPFFRQRFDVVTKADSSPVTEADRAAEQAMRALIARYRPDDGIVGEEYGTERGEAERVWVLDPIDGTRSFLAGRPIFGTLIALVEAGKPVLGIIDQPISGERWIGAAGRQTTFERGRARTRFCKALTDAHFASTGPGYFRPEQRERIDRVVARCRTASWGGDCYNYGLLAAGHVDLVVESGLKLYDFAALVPVVEGAGGTMRDWQGRPLDAASTGEVIAAGDEALLDEVMALLS